MIFFTWIITFYNNWRINSVYYLVLIMVILCSQSIGQISAILFPRDSAIAISFASLILSLCQVLGNILVPVKYLHYSLQQISDISYFKLAYDTMIIAIYGFDRCLENEISLVLYELGIESQMFWRKIIYFILLCIALKSITVLLLIFRINCNLEDNRQSLSIKSEIAMRLYRINF